MENEKHTISMEKGEILQELSRTTIDDPNYKKLTDALDALTKVQQMETEMQSHAMKAEREANLAESKAKAELRIREEEIEVKKKDSRRSVWKVFVAGLFGIGQIVLISNYDEIKPLVGKAWNFVTKPKL